MNKRRRTSHTLFGLPHELSVTLIYLIFSLAWVFFSDRALLSIVSNPEDLARWNMYKGWLFVLATSILLFAILSPLFTRIRSIHNRLGESEELYRILVENQTDLVVKVDPEGRFLFVNPAYCEVFDKTEAELLGNVFMPLVHEGDKESTATEIKKVFEPPHTAYMEQRAMTKAGWRWFAWQDTAILNAKGDVEEIIGVGRDITDRKEAERAYHESNERLHLATSASQIGIWEYDMQNDRLIWDDQVFVLYGVDKGSFTGRFQDWKDTIHPEDIEQAEQAFMEAIEAGAIFDSAFRVVHPSGAIRHIRALARIEIDAKGVPVKAIGTNWDVTESKQLVEALMQSEQDYHQLFENMTTGFILLEVIEAKSNVPKEYRIAQANPAAEQITGLPSEQLLGHSLAEAFQPFDDYWADIFAKVAVTGSPSAYENRIESVGRVLSTWIFVPKPGYLAVVFSDNTARRTAEDAVLRAQQQLQHIFDHTKDIVLQLDLSGRFIFVNAAAGEITGYGVSELLKMNMSDIIAPEFESFLAERLMKRLDGNPDHENFTFEILHREGHRIWLELATNSMYDGQGNLESIQGIARDITGRKESELALEESRRFLRTIIDTIPSRVFWKDLSSTFLGCNLSFAEDAGFDDPEKLVGKNDYELGWSRADADAYRMDDFEVMQSGVGRLNYEEPQTIGEGQIKWMETNKLPIRDTAGKVIGVLGTYEDITERKQLEEDRFRLTVAINQSAEAIVVMDPEGIIQYVNPAFETVIGFGKENVIGKNFSMIIASMQGHTIASTIWKTVQSGNTWRGRISNLGRESELCTVDAVVSPVRDGTGSIVNHVGTIRDITQEVEMETHLRQAQKMDAVGRLAGGVAHDFNNILQSIMGFSGILLTELESGSSQHDDVQEIRTAARRAGDLTRRLLTLSRKQNIEFTAQNLNEIIQRNEVMMRRLLGERIVFEFNLSDSLKPVLADMSQVEQIILNLFINARDAMPDGGCLKVTTNNYGDEVDDGLGSRSQKLGQFVSLIVEDDGYGIRKDVQANIFEPFFTTKKVGEGTGLGLSVVYGIVQQHGGWIDVESQLGKGSVFKVHLPAVDSAAVAKVSPPSKPEISSSPEGKGEKILIVEDDETVRDLGARMLSDAGYTIVTVSTVEEARRAFNEMNDIALIYADVVLPDGKGYDLAIELRESNPDLPVLLCSGYAQDAAMETLLKNYNFSCLEKPVTIMKLLQSIREMLDENRPV